MSDIDTICLELNAIRDLIKLRDEKTAELERLYNRIIDGNFRRIAKEMGLDYSAYGDRFFVPEGSKDET